MQRSPNNRASARPSPRVVILTSATLTLAAWSLSGCTLIAGQPWGQAELTLDVELEVEAARLTPEGWLKTSADFGLEVAWLEVELGPLRLVAPSEESPSGGGEPFDPSNPPEGYSDCHNGHCHSEGGDLVPFADIEGGGAVAGGPTTVVSRRVVNEAINLWPLTDTIDLGECTDDCQLGRVTVSAASVQVTELRYRMRVHDLRPAETARLPPDGVEVEGEIGVGDPLEAPLNERFDRDQPIGLELNAAVVFAPTFFDAVEFDELVGADPDLDIVHSLDGFLSVTEAVHESVEEDARLLVSTARFEPELSDNTVVLLPAPLDAP